MDIKNNPKLKEDIDYITDTFTGADGCAAFFKFKVLMEHLDRKNDAAAKELILVVRRFAKLVETATKIFDEQG